MIFFVRIVCTFLFINLLLIKAISGIVGWLPLNLEQQISETLFDFMFRTLDKK